MIGNDLVCDRCMGAVEQGAEETEIEQDVKDVTLIAGPLWVMAAIVSYALYRWW